MNSWPYAIGWRPVSYTHLDVYKRQVDESPVPPDEPDLRGEEEILPPPDPPLPLLPLLPPEAPGEKRIKYVIGGEVTVYVVAERVQYYGPDGRLITKSLRDYTRLSLIHI